MTYLTSICLVVRFPSPPQPWNIPGLILFHVPWVLLPNPSPSSSTVPTLFWFSFQIFRLYPWVHLFTYIHMYMFSWYSQVRDNVWFLPFIVRAIFPAASTAMVSFSFTAATRGFSNEGWAALTCERRIRSIYSMIRNDISLEIGSIKCSFRGHDLTSHGSWLRFQYQAWIISYSMEPGCLFCSQLEPTLPSKCLWE